jgi:hypothetical protein
MQLLTESLITSLFIIGLYNATSYELDKNGNPTEKNILWFVRYYVDKFIGEPIGKPIILCPRCMASVWGVLFYFGVFQHYNINILWCVVFISVVSALNSLIQRIIEW